MKLWCIPPSLAVAFELLVFARVTQLSVEVFGQRFAGCQLLKQPLAGTRLFLCGARFTHWKRWVRLVFSVQGPESVWHTEEARGL